MSLALILLALACVSDDVTIPQAREPSTGYECLSLYAIGGVVGDSMWATGIDNGAGVLEQRVLQKDLVVLGQVLDVDTKVVPIDSVRSRLLHPSMYEGFEHTLLVEVDLGILEYLKGEGPNRITAVVEGQSVFNTKEEGDCAKTVFTQKFGRLIESDQGIAFLAATGDPNSYHLGYADENFGETWVDHSTWLGGENGGFYDRNREEWIGLDEVRQRVSSVIEEYDRVDDQRWQSCVYSKYFYQGRDPWAYWGVGRAYEDYRDHDIIFNGERVPVPAGTMVWNYPHHNDYRTKFDMRLDGEDAHSFEVLYQSDYERTVNEWRAASGGTGHHLAIWYLPPEGRSEQWRETVSAHVISAIEDLAEGEYQFNLHVEDRSEDFVDCGQEHPEPSKFRVIVDVDRPTVPPAPSNVEVLDDPEGWTIGWDPVDGVTYSWIYVYRLDGDGEKIRAYLGAEVEDSRYRIKFAETKGCGDVIYVEIWPEGDGKTYLKDVGENSEPIELRTGPCVP